MMAQSDNSTVAGNSARNCLRIGGQDTAEIAEILQDDRPVETELRTDQRVALGRHDALARQQRDGIARQQPDKGKGNDRYPDKGRDQYGDAPQKEAKHGRSRLFLFWRPWKSQRLIARQAAASILA
jgi:hypothetical protein